jgi:hypothetical protein
VREWRAASGRRSSLAPVTQPTRRAQTVSVVWARLGALALSALAIAGWVGVASAAGAPRPPVVSFAKAPLGAPLPAGFVGLSFEFSAVPTYTGSAAAVNPAVVQLIRNLTPGQTPVLRIGGNSTDQTWWPVAGVATPAVVKYALTPAWMQTTGALAQALGARLVLGINLAMNRPELAGAEAEAMVAGIGRGPIAEFEIGNEPDVYKVFPEYRNAHGTIEHVRGRGYDFKDFIEQFSAVRRTLPRVPIAGPALGGIGWASNLGKFIADEPGLALVTLHLYPLTCKAPPSSPFYPSIGHLLSNASTTGLAGSVTPDAALARAHRLIFRVDEMNSVTCGGTLGVSDTFASALWALDTAFALDRAGVDGINVHMFPGARYALFSVAGAPGSYSAVVNPEYYGLLMFAQAAPPGSRLVPVSSAPGGPVKVWATVARDKTVRVVLINDSPSTRALVLRAPSGATGAATFELLQAASLGATTGVTLGGQSFGPSTTTGVLPPPVAPTTVSPAGGKYSVTLPPASAAMLTWPPAG